MEYNKQYFIDKFEPIPDKLWITGSLGEEEEHCAMGHCGTRSSDTITEETRALAQLFKPLFLPQFLDTQNINIDYLIIYSINDNSNIHYLHTKLTSKTPKGRILEALKSLPD